MKYVLNRSLVAAFVGVLTALLSAPSLRAEDVSVRLDYLPYGGQAWFYLALANGWFSDAGLHVTIDDGTGSSNTIQLVATGKYDVGYAILSSMIQARDSGIPVKSIGGILRRNDIGVVVANEAKIETPKGLEGHSIAYSPNSIESLFVDRYFTNAGIDKSKVTLLTVDLSAKVTAFLAGKADAMFSPVPIWTIKSMPRPSHGFLFADNGIQLPSFGLVTGEDTLKAKPKMLHAFVAVMQRSVNAIRYDGKADDAVTALLKERSQANLKFELMKEQLLSEVAYIDTKATADKPTLWQAPSDWQDALDSLEKVNAIHKGSKPADYFTNEFVPNTPPH